MNVKYVLSDHADRYGCGGQLQAGTEGVLRYTGRFSDINAGRSSRVRMAPIVKVFCSKDCAEANR